MSPGLASALNRATPRDCSNSVDIFTITATTQSLGQSIDDFTINKPTIIQVTKRNCQQNKC